MSDGYCEVDFSDADADPVEFCKRKTVTARKAHICSECGGPIAAGEHYQRVASVFEGEFGVDKICAPCQETAGEFGCHIVGGVLWEMLYEEWDQGAHVQACINRLESARAKEHMRQQWVKWQERRRLERQARRERLKALGAVDPSATDPGTPTTRDDDSSGSS